MVDSLILWLMTTYSWNPSSYTERNRGNWHMKQPTHKPIRISHSWVGTWTARGCRSPNSGSWDLHQEMWIATLWQRRRHAYHLLGWCGGEWIQDKFCQTSFLSWVILWEHTVPLWEDVWIILYCVWICEKMCSLFMSAWTAVEPYLMIMIIDTVISCIRGY